MNDIFFAIPTVSHYYKETIPKLLQNLKQLGVSDYNIIIFVNESESSQRFTIENGVRHYHSNELSYFEWIIPKIIIEENLFHDWWFLLHDTVSFNETMPNQLKEKILKTTKRIIKLTPIHSNNTGIIHGDIFREYSQELILVISELSKITNINQRKSEIIKREKEVRISFLGISFG